MSEFDGDRRRRSRGRRGSERGSGAGSKGAESVGSDWSYGVRAVESLLNDQPDQVLEVWVQQGGGGARARARARATDKNVTMREVSAEELSRLLPDGANHQGLAAKVRPFSYADPTALVRGTAPRLILVLDGIQDPHNLGAILRTAVGLGCDGVVIPQRRAVGVTAAVRKVSTGAADRIPVARVTNLVRFLDGAKKAGFWCYGTTIAGGDAVSSIDFGERVVMVMGSEGKGMRPLVARHCDALMSLPIRGVQSLNVSVACGIFLYAYRRQREKC